jgi:TonB family protein
MGTLAVLAAATAMAAQDVSRVQPQAVESAVGTVATICGMVKSYQCTMPDKITRLELDTPPRTDVTVAPEHRKRFDAPPEMQYLHRRICVTGQVTKEPDRAEYHVRLTTPADVLIVSEPQPEPVQPYDPGAYFTCDPGVVQPRLVKDAKPQYTSDALRAKVQGRVVLSAIVGADGVPHDITVIQSLDRTNGLDDECVKALSQWRFSPGTLEGRPVPMRITVENAFVLGK